MTADVAMVMGYAMGIVITLFAIMVFLSRAAEPSMVLREEQRTQQAQATVVVLQTQETYLRTQVAIKTTPAACSSYYNAYPITCGGTK